MKIIKAKRLLEVPVDPQASLGTYIRTKLVQGGEFVIVSDKTLEQLRPDTFEVYQTGKKRGRKPKYVGE
jgi:hypothetical protein